MDLASLRTRCRTAALARRSVCHRRLGQGCRRAARSVSRDLISPPLAYTHVPNRYFSAEGCKILAMAKKRGAWEARQRWFSAVVLARLALHCDSDPVIRFVTTPLLGAGDEDLWKRWESEVWQCPAKHAERIPAASTMNSYAVSQERCLRLRRRTVPGRAKPLDNVRAALRDRTRNASGFFLLGNYAKVQAPDSRAA